MIKEEGWNRVADAMDRFVDTCRGEHDADPTGWHRGMLAPPPSRSTECAFCHRPWDDIKQELSGQGLL